MPAPLIEPVAPATRSIKEPLFGSQDGPSLSSRPRPDKAGLLRSFLSAYWLRPENALWMTLRSVALSKVRLARPSLDISCGDGVFSFLHLGGAFDPAFDVFTSVALTQSRDMFDHVSDEYRPAVEIAPRDRIDVGADVKTSMLQKAERLRLYDRLIEHDNNLRLPFEDGTFQTVYCNAAYWVRNIAGFLAELGRITRPGGRIVLQVKLSCMKDYTLRRLGPALGGRFVELLDGGRFDCWPSLADRRIWEDRFARAGLEIEEELPFVTRTHAHLWDVGLRPIAPLLIRMANALTPSTRDSIKADWVDLFHELLTPLCHPHLDLLPGHREPAETQYVLRPRFCETD